jgi:hypothetical protein
VEVVSGASIFEFRLLGVTSILIVHLGEITARLVEIIDQAQLNWVGAGRKDNGNGSGRRRRGGWSKTPADIRQLILEMSDANQLWGAPDSRS